MQGDRSNLEQKGLDILIMHVIETYQKVGCPTNLYFLTCRLVCEPHRKGCPDDHTAVLSCHHQLWNAPHPRRWNSLPICLLMLLQGLLLETTSNFELVNIHMKMPLLEEWWNLGKYPRYMDSGHLKLPFVEHKTRQLCYGSSYFCESFADGKEGFWV